MVKNPGTTASLFFPIDGPASRVVPDQEWQSLHGTLSLANHRAYLRQIGALPQLADSGDR
jgi:hypothetical protein